MKKRLIIVAVLLTLILVSAVFSPVSEWTKWRGSNGDGIYEETEWDPHAINSPKIMWEKDIGVGFSSISIKDNLLYTMGSVEKSDTTFDVVYCIDARNGDEIWRFEYACPQGEYKGPRATPVLSDGLVYTMSRRGHIFCLDATDGRMIWQDDVIKNYKFEEINWGLASSARFFKDLLIFNAGRAGIAFDKKSGEVVWSNGPGKAGYATPVLYVKDGTTFATIFAHEKLYDVDATTGKIIWSYDWNDKYEVYAADPVISDNRLFLTTEGGQKGCVLLDISKQKPKEIWSNFALRSTFCTGLLTEGYLYGVNGGPGPRAELKCLKFATGEEQWSQRLGFGDLRAADGKLLFLDEEGTLIVIEIDPSGYREIARGKILQKRVCWTAPVLSDGKIYARNNPGQLVCVDVSRKYP